MQKRCRRPSSTALTAKARVARQLSSSRMPHATFTQDSRARQACQSLVAPLHSLSSILYLLPSTFSSSFSPHHSLAPRGYFDRERIRRADNLCAARTGREAARIAATTSSQPTCGCRPSLLRLPTAQFNSHDSFRDFRRNSFPNNRFAPMDNCAPQFSRCAQQRTKAR